MKTRKKIITSIIIIIITMAVFFRLYFNKRSLDAAQDTGTNFNTIIPVITDTVKAQYYSPGIRANGSFSPLYEVSVISETQGTVKDVFVEIGDKVTENQQLAIADTVLTSAQFEQTLANYNKAEKDLHRFDTLAKDDAVSIEQFESVKVAYSNAQAALVAAKKQYENAVIKTPVNGVITKRYIEKGTFLMPGMPVFDIIEISSVKFVAKLLSTEVVQVKRGQKIMVTVDAFPGVVFDGMVTVVNVNADEAKRYDVEIKVINRYDTQIKPGMYGSVLFNGNPAEETLLVPRKALEGSVKTPRIFIVKGDSVILQNIVAEPIDDQYLAVKEGLEAGDIIVTSGQINLKNHSKVRITN